MQQALVAVAAIRLSAGCVALASVGEELVDGVHDYLEKLMVGKGPKAEDIAELDVFFKMCVKRMENFCTVDIYDTAVGAKGKLFAAPPANVKKLVGLGAVRFIFKTCVTRFEDKKAQPLTAHDLKPLKTFSWMLSPVQVAQVSQE